MAATRASISSASGSAIRLASEGWAPPPGPSPAGPDHPGVIAPPPLIFLGFLLLGWALNQLAPAWSFGISATPRWALAGGLVLIGAALIMAAIGRFRAAGTPPEPWKTPTAFVAAGIYRFSRNPMYLGMALIHLGLALGLDSPIAAILLAPAVVVVHIGVIQREERYLEAKFGEPYLRYKAKVRAWL